MTILKTGTVKGKPAECKMSIDNADLLTGIAEEVLMDILEGFKNKTKEFKESVYTLVV